MCFKTQNQTNHNPKRMSLKSFTWDNREIKEQKNTKALALLYVLAWLVPLTSDCWEGAVSSSVRTGGFSAGCDYRSDCAHMHNAMQFPALIMHHQKWRV